MVEEDVFPLVGCFKESLAPEDRRAVPEILQPLGNEVGEVFSSERGAFCQFHCFVESLGQVPDEPLVVVDGFVWCHTCKFYVNVRYPI